MTGHRQDAEHVVNLLGAECDVTLRHFFGGWSIVRGGIQVGIVMDAVYIKVSEPHRGRWRAAGSVPFEYISNGRPVIVAAYWSAPAAALDDGDLLRRIINDPSDPNGNVTEVRRAPHAQHSGISRRRDEV